MITKKNIKVLIAEDDFLVSDELQRILTELGYDVVGMAANGELAIKMAGSLKPDIVLMDIKMPKIDGLMATQKIHESYSIPVVILTAHESKNLINWANDIGVSAYLLKPPNSNEIDLAITIGLARHDDLMKLSQLNQILNHEIAERKEAEEKVKSLLKEKEILLREVHHRVKNNMITIKGILRLQSNILEIPEAVSSFQDAISRINSMELLYDKLYKNESYEDIYVKQYFLNLTGEIFQMFPESHSILIKRQFDDFIMEVREVFALGIILNELITNSMKYAFPNKKDSVIQISIVKKQKHVKIIYEDNGIGIPENKLNDDKQFGLLLIEMMVKQIHGNYKIETDNGTRFIIEFDIT